jgi:hypothetical protein
MTNVQVDSGRDEATQELAVSEREQARKRFVAKRAWHFVSYVGANAF